MGSALIDKENKRLEYNTLYNQCNPSLKISDLWRTSFFYFRGNIFLIVSTKIEAIFC